MPRGTNQNYRTKQQRPASKIQQSAKLKGRSTKVASGGAGAAQGKRTGGRKPRTGK